MTQIVSVFLDDGDTYSGLSGASVRIFEDPNLDELNEIKQYSEIDLQQLFTELLNKKELLPLEIQELIKPLDN